MSSFAALKQNSALETLVKKLEQQSNSYGQKDERFWQATQDQKTMLGSAVIRFLPTSPDSDAPWVKLYQHGFKNEETGKWFIAECPTTIGGECYCCQQNQILWKGSEADKKVAASRKRKTAYIANILVIKDPAHPENNGKQFLMRFGQQIFDKIIQKIKPEFEDDKPVNVFDFWGGADFNIRITRNEGGFKSFEKSFFSDSAPLFGGDDTQLEAVWKKEYDLHEFNAADKYESAEKLKERFEQVVNGTAPAATSAANRVLEQMAQAAEKPSFKAPTPADDAPPFVPTSSTAATPSSDDEWSQLLNDL
jgi:hypothetical protein